MSSRKKPRPDTTEEGDLEPKAPKIVDRKQIDDRPSSEDMEDSEEVSESEDEESESMEMDPIVEKTKVSVVKEQKIFRPGVDTLEEGEELKCDPSAYEMFHQATSDWPCLSLDVIRDTFGNRSKYPLTMYVVAGTQADKAENNRVTVMKLSNITRTEKGDVSESESESDEDEDPRFDFRMIVHRGGVNRIRAMPQGPIVSTWSDDGTVRMYSIAKEISSLDTPTIACDNKPKPLTTFRGHLEEGFAMAFNPHQEHVGKFLSGDSRGSIAFWQPTEAGWNTELLSRALHQGPVEDIAWKASGEMCQHVWASCSVDQHVSVWDIREQATKPKINIHAHDADVNVISWNPIAGALLLTGSDDGSFKIFDIRNPDTPMAHFHWHKEPITSVDWHPTDETTLAVASADNCITLWDVAVEADDDDEVPDGAEYFPPQLLFLHQGQQDPKEIRWHPQIPGVLLSTGSNGFNFFKACNM